MEEIKLIILRFMRVKAFPLAKQHNIFFQKPAAMFKISSFTKKILKNCHHWFKVRIIKWTKNKKKEKSREKWWYRNKALLRTLQRKKKREEKWRGMKMKNSGKRFPRWTVPRRALYDDVKLGQDPLFEDQQFLIVKTFPFLFSPSFAKKKKQNHTTNIWKYQYWQYHRSGQCTSEDFKPTKRPIYSII